MTAPWREIVDDIAARCAAAGFDLVQPLQVAWYNAAVEAAYRLHAFGRPDALGILIGNTRRVWRPFLRALRARPALLDDPDPIERYAVEGILPALESIAPQWEVRWAHDPPPRRVAMQRLAHVSGLAGLSPSFLSVHPVYGPWIALRAVVVVDVPGPPGPPPDAVLPCADCEHACLPPFARAVATRDTGSDVAEAWTQWLAVRDACPVGREHRYSEEQIEYHYRKDRAILRRAVERLAGG